MNCCIFDKIKIPFLLNFYRTNSLYKHHFVFINFVDDIFLDNEMERFKQIKKIILLDLHERK
jgi:predicted AAA+ superfamily ATPase